MNWQDDAAPSMIGLFKVERRIGAGGMGVVYLATSPSGREVAVKVIRKEHADDPEFRARFRREVSAARQVSGAFTAPVLDADPDAKSPWMATLYIPAPTLSERIHTGELLTEADARTLGCGLAEALRDIHRAGLVHRDLKPSNVLLTDDGPRVIDFGIARVTDGDLLTHTGKVIGTPPFMAPEQMRSARDIGPAADVFAFGCVLTYAAAGHGPFDASTPYAVAYKVVHEAPDLDGVPDELRSIIEGCLRKAPEDRPTPDELLTLLISGEPLWRPQRNIRTRIPAKIVRHISIGIAILAVSASVFILRPNGTSNDSPKTKQSTLPSAAPASPIGPQIEPAAENRPDGWALWEKSLRKNSQSVAYGYVPTCTALNSSLICSAEGIIAARIDPEDGDIIWSKSTTEDLRGGEVIGSSDGVVLVMTGDQGELLALDIKTGGQLWSTQITGGLSDVTVRGSTVYIFFFDAEGSRIEARDVRTGKLRRPPLRLDTDRDYSLLVGHGGALYIFEYIVSDSSPNSVDSLDPNTLKKQKTYTLSEKIGEPIAADRDGVIFLSDSKTITRLSVATGQERRVSLQHPITGQPVLNDATLIMSRPDGMTAAYNTKTGKRLWVTRTNVESPGKPVIADDLLYTLAADGRITCLEISNGTELWRSAARRNPDVPIQGVGTSNSNKPAIYNGVAYAGSSTGSIFAISPPNRVHP
ncbi:serine/threonine-protein kinase [Streptomyces niveus]|uniref:serine/threonine-protein kinase n=1 Tax=Streptomyces niveus TaxID=193462 RepID=UPI0013319EEE|nr:serine/threonine-protein kinase [Streptomyces niveus]